MIFIFSAESALLRRAGGGDEGRRLAKDEGCRGEGGVGWGGDGGARVWQRLAAAGGSGGGGDGGGWLAERRRQWCRPVARWRQPWYSNPIAKRVGASAGTCRCRRCRCTQHRRRMVITREGSGGTSAVDGGGGGGYGAESEGADTTLDISYPSARNPLTS